MEIRDWVIDADTHITEPADVWTSRVPAKFRDRAPRLVRDPKTGWDHWSIAGEAPIVPIAMPLRSENSIQISGTSTPSSLRHATSMGGQGIDLARRGDTRVGSSPC